MEIRTGPKHLLNKSIDLLIDLKKRRTYNKIKHIYSNIFVNSNYKYTRKQIMYIYQY